MKQQHTSGKQKLLRIWKHFLLSPPVGCTSKTGLFLKQQRWSCSSSRCPAAGRISTQLSSSVVRTTLPTTLYGAEQNLFLFLANRGFLLEDETDDPTVSRYSHTDVSGKERAPFQSQPCKVCLSPWSGRARKGSQPFVCGLSLVSIFHSSSLSHASHLHWL